MRDAFGRLLVEPERLDVAGRVECLRRAAGALQAAESREARWIGRALSRWLHGDGDDLVALLGVKPGRGSRTTAQKLVRQDLQDRLLLRLSVALGGDAQACRVLRGTSPCPPRHADLLHDVREAECPTSRAALGRARRRVSRAHR